MSRYRPRHGADGARRGWLLGEAAMLLVAGAVVVALNPSSSSEAARPVVRAAVAPVAPAGTSSDAADLGSRAATASRDVSAPMPASPPVRLLVPAIGVDSELLDLGLKDDGTMQVPAEGFPAGWYTGAPTPGELGPGVLAGHVDWAGAPGVFAALHELAPGAEILVLRQDGSTAVFAVTEVGRFPKDAFPTDAVYGDLDHAGLRLITCGGEFDRGARSYVDNVVVFAELVEARTA